MFESSLLSVQIFSSLTLVGDVFFPFLLLFLFLGSGKWHQKIFSHIGHYAFQYGLFTVGAGILGSMFFSSVIGFAPCELCWYQRIFLFPQFFIFAVALWKKDNTAIYYSLALSLVGIVLAFYQSYIQWGGLSILPCTAEGAECSKIFFKEFGYITIPVMSFTTFAYLILLMYIRKRSTTNRV
ncbi:MAG: disulfide bond formation protein B [Patescibacteria group bacterium]|nr:disulfide bond formation protein B [bacterium]MDZ4240612.1 disulfide bond formation protein B [Patescibacteria group bacterium]